MGAAGAYAYSEAAASAAVSRSMSARRGPCVHHGGRLGARSRVLLLGCRGCAGSCRAYAAALTGITLCWPPHYRRLLRQPQQPDMQRPPSIAATLQRTSLNSGPHPLFQKAQPCSTRSTDIKNAVFEEWTRVMCEFTGRYVPMGTHRGSPCLAGTSRAFRAPCWT